SIVVSATTDSQLARLRELAGDDIAAWIAGRPANDAVTALNDGRVPAVEINSRDELATDEHVIARRSIVEVGGRSIPAPSPKLSATPGMIGRAAPALGEHTDEVVEEWLGGPDS